MPIRLRSSLPAIDRSPNLVLPMIIPASAKLASIAEMQQAERAADAGGHSFAAMMEIAGAATAREILARYRDVEREPLRVLVLAGPGNNGGDGLVCARHLVDAGVRVRVYLWRRRTAYGEDYQGHFAKLVAHRVPYARTEDDLHYDTLREWIAESDVIVDALLGTGASRALQGDVAQILDAVRASRLGGEASPALVAVDAPSGVHSDTGALDPHTAPADVTVTFGFAKHGLYKFPGAAACGEIVVAPIGIPAEQAQTLRTFLLTGEIVRQWLPERSANSHKGSFGKAMIAAGSMNYVGAAILSTSAAGRAGAGLVTGAIPESVWHVAAGRVAEATWLPLPAQAGSFDAAAAAPLRQAVAAYSSLLLGCGLTQAAHTQQFVRQMLAGNDSALPPTVIDADGLNALAHTPNWHTLLPPNCILTPHVAEFARLLHVEQEEVLSLRWELALEAASLWNAVVLAKGPYTVIASPGGDLAVLPVATPALATAGTGDVLAGAIVALLAQGLGAFEAACLGAWLHGEAGLRCAVEIGPAGVVASDLLPRLPRMLNELRNWKSP